MMNLHLVAVLCGLFAVGEGSRQEDLRLCVCHDSVAGESCVGSGDGCTDYGVAIAKTAGAPLVVFFVLFFGLWCFGCLRGCFHWCGDSRPRSGCCLRGKETHRGYAGREVMMFRGAMLITLLTALAVGIPSLTSNEQITSGVNGLGGVVDNFVAVVLRSIDVLEHETGLLIDLSAEDRTSISSEAASARKEVSDISSYREDVLAYDNTNTFSRKRLVLAVIAVCFFCFTLLGCISVFKMHGCLSSLISSLIMTVGFWLAILSCTHYGLSLVAEDLCNDYSPLTQNLFAKLEDSMGCDRTKDTGISQIITRTQDAQDTFVTRVCTDVLPQICQSQSGAPPLFSCPQGPCGPSGKFYMFADVLEGSQANSIAVATPGSGFGSCVAGSCSIADCAQQCEAGSTVREQARSAVGNYTTYGKAFEAIQREVYPVASCMVLGTLRDQLAAPLCDDVSPPLTSLARIFLSFTCLLWLSALLITLGTKRFTSPVKSKLGPTEL